MLNITLMVTTNKRTIEYTQREIRNKFQYFTSKNQLNTEENNT